VAGARSVATRTSRAYDLVLPYLLDGDPDGAKQRDGIADPIIVGEVDHPHVAGIDESLGACDTWKVGREDNLVQLTRRVAVDDGVLLRLQTSAVADALDAGAVAVIREAARVPLYPIARTFL
jgi:hypothetical protein